MELTPERIALLQSLFEQAIELPAGQRAFFLAGIEEEEAGLREDVMALIAAHESGATLPHAGLAGDVASSLLNRRVGPWRVERLLGQGGMGTVCEAVRADAQFEKRVAIKFLHAHAANPSTEQRFRAERQILANLDHPNVATLLDGGVTEDGQPYIVMEFIDGEPITMWADARSLSRRARVELLLQVCAAVEAAHASLIVHRDLKPGNILVTSEGRVKLLDFGIARLLGEVAPESAGTRGSEQRSFTPSYAAPEQLRAAPVTTATDVFALGVVLFRLLTGMLPFASRANPDQPAAPAELEPDLDAIIARAMHVEVAQRYSTVQELRADLERWLKDEAVLAYAGGARYRLQRFVRRHRTGSALGALAAVVVCIATGIAAWQYQAARRAAADQQELNAFLMDVLNMSDPYAEGEDLTLGVALDRATGRIDERFAGRPDLSAQIRFGIGYSMLSRYELEQAEKQLLLAFEESRTGFGADDVRTLRVEEAIAWLRLEQGRLEESEAAYRGLIESLESGRHTGDPLYSVALGNLGNLYLQQERYAEADRELQRAQVASSSRDVPMDPDENASNLSNLAHAAHGLEDYERAEQYYAEAGVAYREVFPEGSPDLAILYNNHALLHEDRGDIPEALQMHQESLAMRRKVFQGEHPMIVVALSNVARLSQRTGDVATALTLATEGAAMADGVYTEPNRFHAYMHATLADAQLGNGDVAGARASMRRARELLAEFSEAPASAARWVNEVGDRVDASGVGP